MWKKLTKDVDIEEVTSFLEVDKISLDPEVQIKYVN